MAACTRSNRPPPRQVQALVAALVLLVGLPLVCAILMATGVMGPWMTVIWPHHVYMTIVSSMVLWLLMLGSIIVLALWIRR